MLTAAGISQDGTGGFYAFGRQRIAYRLNPAVKNSSVSAFYQVGANNSQTMPMTQYYGAGVTGFGLIGSRESDLLGVGVGLTKLNPNLFARQYELMFQGYYQAHLFATTFLQPTLTYIPHPRRVADDTGCARGYAATDRAFLTCANDDCDHLDGP